MEDKDKRYDMLSNDDRSEAIRIKKIRQGEIENSDKESFEEQKKKTNEFYETKKEKRKNFWDYNKWKIIIGSIVLSVVTFLIVQAATVPKYDTTVLLCGYSYFDEETLSKLSENFEEYLSDIDKNGEVEVGVFQAQYKKADDEEYQTAYTAALQSRIMSEIASGKNCIFVLEKELIESFNEKGIFKELDAEGLSDVKNALPLKNTKLLKDINKINESGEYYIAIRVFKEDSDKENYEAQNKVILKIQEELKSK